MEEIINKVKILKWKLLLLAGVVLIIVLFFVFLILGLTSTPVSKQQEKAIDLKEELSTQELKNQYESDKKEAQIMKDLYEKYPWYDIFPIKEETYFIGFTPFEDEFFIGINLYATNEDEEKIKNLALEKLRSLKIDLKDFKITYKTYR
jgi:hypothetical protein